LLNEKTGIIKLGEPLCTVDNKYKYKLGSRNWNLVGGVDDDSPAQVQLYIIFACVYVPTRSPHIISIATECLQKGFDGNSALRGFRLRLDDILYANDMYNMYIYILIYYNTLPRWSTRVSRCFLPPKSQRVICTRCVPFEQKNRKKSK
jgi:hypothetical protein